MQRRFNLFAIPFGFAAVLFAAAAPAAFGQDVVNMEAPIKVDQATFEHYFGFGGDAELKDAFDRNAAEIELKLREIAADKSVTAEQLDKIRMAGYSEKMVEPRRRLDARRRIVGKSFPSMNAVFAAYNSSADPMAIFGRTSKSMINIVYDRVLTPEQKKNHATFRAERRARLVRAGILVRVAQLSEQVAMLPGQEVALAKLIAKEMPPASLFDDESLESVIGYATALVPSEELERVLAPNQVELLKQYVGDGSGYRDQLRSGNTLERITAYRAAREKAANDGEAPPEQK